MDDTFSSNYLFVYSPYLYVDISIMFYGLLGGLDSAGSVFKFVWQFVIRQCCRNPLSVRNSFLH